MEQLNRLRKTIKPNDRKNLLVLGTLTVLLITNSLFGALAFLLVALLCHAREHYGVLEKCGIPVIKPTLFLGSEPNFHKTVLHLADIERFNKYGGIWGSYIGRSPQIFIADPELIRLVMVKDFAHFADRQDINFGPPLINEVVGFLPGEKWKQVRAHMSPLFTLAKINKASSVIAESTEEFMNDLRCDCDQNGRLKFECGRQLSTWLIGLFTKIALGVQLENYKSPDNKFAKSFRNLLGEEQEMTWLFSLSLSFPILAKFAPAFDPAPGEILENTFRQVINSGKQKTSKGTNEFLEILCNMWEKISTKEFQELGISENTVLAQALVFFLGGSDSTSSTLTHLLLFMAEHPDIQEKMHDELIDALARRETKNGDDKNAPKLEINHELVEDSNIPYIVACINETLRLAPALHRPERICTKDWQHNGISIKKGTIVMIPTWAANRNPKVFPDEPNKFKPERFLPEAKTKLHPYALTTFGFGPRSCVGMRFSYENMKYFVCNFLKIFRVEKRADTQMKYKTGKLVVISFGPVYLDLILRD